MKYRFSEQKQLNQNSSTDIILIDIVLVTSYCTTSHCLSL